MRKREKEKKRKGERERGKEFSLSVAVAPTEEETKALFKEKKTFTLTPRAPMAAVPAASCASSAAGDTPQRPMQFRHDKSLRS